MTALQTFAEQKRLPVEFLERHGLSVGSDGCINIAYGDGGRARIRQHPETANPTLWATGDTRPMRTYGHDLVEKMAAGSNRSLLIVEGESDSLTAWKHGRPAIGVPGATMAHVIRSEDVALAEGVAIVREPGDAGTTFIAKTAAHLRALGFAGEIAEVSLDPFKDVSELHIGKPRHEDFTAFLEAALAKATPVAAPIARPSQAHTTKRLAISCAADIVPERVEWLWRGRIPCGMLTLLVGDPGAAKSFSSLAIAASVTTGAPLPDGGDERRDPRRVLLWNGEDSKAHTIRPRAAATGVALENLYIIDNEIDEVGQPRPFSLSSVALLRQTMDQVGDVGLVIVDPVGDLLAGVDANRDNDVRAGLQPLRVLAEQTGAAVLIVAHLNKKDAERAIYRVGGSIGFVAVARSVLLCAVDSEDDSKRVIAHVKGNLCRKPPAVEFRIDDEGKFWWGKTTDATAEELLRGSNYGGVRHKAEAFLHEILSNGPKPTTEVEGLARERGISESTLKRARRPLGVMSRKMGSTWYLSLPGVEEGQ